MIFTKTKLGGSYIIEMEKLLDYRGFFARAWCQQEFEAHGLNTRFVQANIGFSKKRGTLRGLHFQVMPHEEIKLVRCTRGAVYDVIVDLLAGSPTYKQWVGVELSADNYRMLYAPEGFAHGYQTLTDDAEIVYQTSQFYRAGSARGVRYNDPAFGIEWPMEVQVISDQDKSWPDYP